MKKLAAAIVLVTLVGCMHNITPKSTALRRCGDAVEQAAHVACMAEEGYDPDPTDPDGYVVDKRLVGWNTAKAGLAGVTILLFNLLPF